MIVSWRLRIYFSNFSRMDAMVDDEEDEDGTDGKHVDGGWSAEQDRQPDLS